MIAEPMPTVAPLTAQEFSGLASNGMRQELFQGVLIEMPPAKYRHGWVIEQVRLALAEPVYGHRLGRLISEVGFVLSSNPDTIRSPDLAFLSGPRIPDQPVDEYLRGAPDLAVEVVSPGDRAEDLELKVDQYLAAGSAAVLVLYPKTQKAHLYEPGRAPRILSARDRLSLPDLFGEWSVTVGDLF